MQPAMIRVFESMQPDHEVLLGAMVDAAQDAMARLGVTAFVCASDGIGYSLAAALSARGVRVPQDVSITGFDGVEPTPGVARLTSLATPFEQIGRAAFSLLRSRIRDGSMPSRTVLIDCPFVEGQSTGRPREGGGV
jgi:DNA-binding LacI/PurR family transcriptional regulator